MNQRTCTLLYKRRLPPAIFKQQYSTSPLFHTDSLRTTMLCYFNLHGLKPIHASTAPTQKPRIAFQNSNRKCHRVTGITLGLQCTLCLPLSYNCALWDIIGARDGKGKPSSLARSVDNRLYIESLLTACLLFAVRTAGAWRGAKYNSLQTVTLVIQTTDCS